MKRLVFKSYVKNLLIVFNFILFMLLASECNNLLYFIISKIIFLIIFLINFMLLEKYGK